MCGEALLELAAREIVSSQVEPALRSVGCSGGVGCYSLVGADDRCSVREYTNVLLSRLDLKNIFDG